MSYPKEVHEALKRIRRALHERRITWEAAIKLAARAKAQHAEREGAS